MLWRRDEKPWLSRGSAPGARALASGGDGEDGGRCRDGRREVASADPLETVAGQEGRRLVAEEDVAQAGQTAARLVAAELGEERDVLDAVEGEAVGAHVRADAVDGVRAD